MLSVLFKINIVYLFHVVLSVKLIDPKAHAAMVLNDGTASSSSSLGIFLLSGQENPYVIG